MASARREHVSSSLLARRASAVLGSYLLSVQTGGRWLVPANVCPVVPAVFAWCGREFEFVDIDPRSLCMDEVEVLRRLTASPRDFSGVMFVRTYGHRGSFEPFFKAIRNLGRGHRIIDDRCLCNPGIAHSGGAADLELYSTGYSKYVDLGGGGWGCFRDCPPSLPVAPAYEESAHQELVSRFRLALRERQPFRYPDSPWLDFRPPNVSVNQFFACVEAGQEDAAAHRRHLNEIYESQLGEWAVPEDLREWRFSILCDCQEAVLRAVFSTGHFASAHYASLVPMFGIGTGTLAQAHATRVVNLFNDFRYTAERARDLAGIVRGVLATYVLRRG